MSLKPKAEGQKQKLSNNEMGFEFYTFCLKLSALGFYYKLKAKG